MSDYKTNEKKLFNIPVDRMTKKFFWAIFLICFIIAGVDQGIILLMAKYNIPDIIQAHIGFFYWLIAAFLLALYIRKSIKISYEKNIKKISEATLKIANGDFSVRLEPIEKNVITKELFDPAFRDINIMAGELGSIETLKTDFISSISHEMKTPLAVIKNYAELLESTDNINNEQKEYLMTIKDSADKMTNLITNILKLNKIENEKIHPERKTYNLSNQIFNVLLQFENDWEEKDIDLEVDVNEGCMIDSDEGLLEIVWDNIISNAIKFTDKGGKVFVSLKKDEEKCIVTVRDSGIGISESELNHIFDKFYQVNTAGKNEGNGIGLSLVKKIVELVGGEVKVKSKLGEGTEFKITI